MLLFPAGRIKESSGHVLPAALDEVRILSDQAASALFQQLLGAALADSRDSGVRFDGDQQVALIEKRIWVGRRVNAHAGNFHLGNSRSGNGRGRDAR
jgi:hypothetical protein